MQVTFSSIDDQLNKIEFTSNLEQLEHHYWFEDKSMPNTMIHLWIEGNCIFLKRTGQTLMNMVFDPTEETLADYKSNIGLSFEFIIHCTKLSISSKQIIIHYEMKQDDDFISKHQISFVFH